MISDRVHLLLSTFLIRHQTKVFKFHCKGKPLLAHDFFSLITIFIVLSGNFGFGTFWNQEDKCTGANVFVNFLAFFFFFFCWQWEYTIRIFITELKIPHPSTMWWFSSEVLKTIRKWFVLFLKTYSGKLRPEMTSFYCMLEFSKFQMRTINIIVITILALEPYRRAAFSLLYKQTWTTEVKIIACQNLKIWKRLFSISFLNTFCKYTLLSNRIRTLYLLRRLELYYLLICMLILHVKNLNFNGLAVKFQLMN